MSKLDTIVKKAITRAFSSKIKKCHPSDTDIHEVVRSCRHEIAKSEDSGIMPSPIHFEQVAVLSRKEKRYDNEIAICEMYIGLVEQYAAKHKLSTSEFTDQVLPECTPLYKRMHNAKIMLSRKPSKL